MILRFFTILFFSCSFLSAQNYVLKSYSVTEGLPQSQVFDILEDHNGILWLGTRGGGVALFNGNDFKVFGTTDGLPSNFVSAFFQDHRNNIWVGTSNGVGQYNGIKFRSFLLEGSSFPVNVTSITEIGEKLYFGTSNGLYIRENLKIRNATVEYELPGHAITDVFKDRTDRLWVAHNKGVSRIDLGKTMHYSAEGLGSSFPQCISESGNGDLWVGTYGKGVYKIYGSKSKKISMLDGLIVLDVFPDGDWLWLSTLKNGVLKYHIVEERVERIQHADQFPTKNCRLTYKDSWGSYWIGTSGGGLLKYAQSPIKSYKSEDGLQGNYIYAVAASSDSAVWLSTVEKKLLKVKNDKFEEYGIDQNLFALKIKSILEDAKGRLWLGTEGEGLVLYENGKSRFFVAGKHLGSNFIKDVVEDKQGNIWVATSNGITKMSPQLSNLKQYNKRNKNIHFNRVNTLWIDRSGRLWYGTQGKGLGVLDQKDSLQVFTMKEGLSDNTIKDIGEDKKGNLYIATAGSGIDILSPYTTTTEVANLSQKNGLASNNIYSVFCDHLNNIWAAGSNGVDKISNPLKSDRSIKNFGKAEGYTGMEATSGAVAMDLNGDIYWGTINGLMRSAFNDYQGVDNDPKLSIRGVNLFYENIQGTPYEPHILNWYTPNNLVLNYNDNHIGFDLNGSDLNQPDGIKYKWRLDGGKGVWTPPLSQSEIYFSNLSPGSYIFQAIAVNKDGAESNEIQFHFVVKSPFYFRWWFLLGTLIAVVSIVVFLIKSRIRKIREKAKAIQDKLRLERDVLEMEQKALRLQMNPHFIFNALNAIQDQIRDNNNKNARYSLMKFSKLMRQILEHSRSERIPLEQEVALIDNYLGIEKLSRENTFNYSITVDSNIDVEEEGIPPMLIQPFIENAIIHGIASNESIGEIKIDFKIDGEALVVEIVDNGVGVEEAKKLKAQTEHQHKSIALDVIQARLEKLSTAALKAKYMIEDVLEDGKVKGTKVTLVIVRGELF